jgi:UrcA family protein
MKSRFNCLTVLGSALCLLTLNTALANEVMTHEITTGSVAVSFGDLDLAKPAGLASLHRRVESAARRVCGVENFRVSLDLARRNRECVAATIDMTLGKMDTVRLTAL